MTSIHIDETDLGALRSRVERLADADYGELLDRIGTEITDQTVHRIAQTKTAPDGAAWRPWSARYAATRHAGHSLLEGEGHLLRSIQHLVDEAAGVEIGSNLVYAATHQYGHPPARIPARPYLGLNANDEADIEAIASRFLETLGA